MISILTGREEVANLKAEAVRRFPKLDPENRAHLLTDVRFVERDGQLYIRLAVILQGCSKSWLADGATMTRNQFTIVGHGLNGPAARTSFRGALIKWEDPRKK